MKNFIIPVAIICSVPFGGALLTEIASRPNTEKAATPFNCAEVAQNKTVNYQQNLKEYKQNLINYCAK